MDVLEKVESIEERKIQPSKEVVLNKIIAAGLNSISHCLDIDQETENRKLINLYVMQSFDKIIDCWPMLNPKVQFHIFKLHVVEFEKFMKANIGEK